MTHLTRYRTNPYYDPTDIGYRGAHAGRVLLVHQALTGRHPLTAEPTGKGVYVTVQQGNIDPRIMTLSYGPGGIGLLVIPMNRRSNKQIERVAEAIDEYVPTICQLAAQFDRGPVGRYMIWALKQRGFIPHGAMPTEQEIQAIIATAVAMQLTPRSA